MKIIKKVNKLGAFLGNIKLILGIVLFCQASFLAIFIDSNSAGANYVINLDNYDEIAPNLKDKCNSLKDYYNTEYSDVYFIHNGTIYAGDIHGKKISKFLGSDGGQPTRYRLEDEPIINFWNEKVTLEKYGYINADTLNEKQMRDYPHLHQLMRAYELTNIVIVPIYKVFNTGLFGLHDKKRLVGFFTYEYIKHVDIDSKMVACMIKEKKIVEFMIQNNK